MIYTCMMISSSCFISKNVLISIGLLLYSVLLYLNTVLVFLSNIRYRLLLATIPQFNCRTNSLRYPTVCIFRILILDIWYFYVFYHVKLRFTVFKTLAWTFKPPVILNLECHLNLFTVHFHFNILIFHNYLT